MSDLNPYAVQNNTEQAHNHLGHALSAGSEDTAENGLTADQNIEVAKVFANLALAHAVDALRPRD